ncbi:hypothetical protein JS608_02527 [Bacillus amyloliquefaciens]|nr:hypothetical protein [Bacillus amyloliquefaciens]UBZ23386.1 hypothetical protein JS608_02527 [Bacillus amyloliquefaciens]
MILSALVWMNLANFYVSKKNKEGRYKTLEYVLSKTIDPYIDKPKQATVISR